MLVFHRPRSDIAGIHAPGRISEHRTRDHSHHRLRSTADPGLLGNDPQRIHSDPRVGDLEAAKDGVNSNRITGVSFALAARTLRMLRYQRYRCNSVSRVLGANFIKSARRIQRQQACLVNLTE